MLKQKNMRNYTLVLLGLIFILIAGKSNGSEHGLEQAHALRSATPTLTLLEGAGRPQEHTSLFAANDTGRKVQDALFHLGSACWLSAITTTGIWSKLVWDRHSNSCPDNEAINILQTTTLSLVLGGLGCMCMAAHLKYRRDMANQL